MGPVLLGALALALALPERQASGARRMKKKKTTAKRHGRRQKRSGTRFYADIPDSRGTIWAG
jgi:hypothetical protein